MRIWSLHPKYMDAKGLVALWRETLLAKHVLEGKTKGYLNHPQLNRFKELKRPLDGINLYLSFIFDEATLRGYQFDKNKFLKPKKIFKMKVNQGQLNFEWQHLLAKLKIRDQILFDKFNKFKKIEPNPLFEAVKGPIENWEIIISSN